MSDIEELMKLAQELFEDKPPEVEQRLNMCPECNVDMVIRNSIYTCDRCGLSDVYNPLLVSSDRWIVKKSLYMRRSYFIERLNLIAGFKNCGSSDYNNVVKRLKRCKFKTIKRLRRHMKRLGFNKFYKYVYNIFYDIKGVRVVNLDRQTIQRLAAKFVKYNARFKTSSDLHGRKNIYSYSLIIYLIFQSEGINGFEKLLLPRQTAETLRLLKLHCCPV